MPWEDMLSAMDCTFLLPSFISAYDLGVVADFCFHLSSIGAIAGAFLGSKGEDALKKHHNNQQQQNTYGGKPW